MQHAHSHAGVAGLEQESHGIGVASLASVHERRNAVAVLRVDVGAGFEQSLNARDAADTGTEVQRRAMSVGADL